MSAESWRIAQWIVAETDWKVFPLQDFGKGPKAKNLSKFTSKIVEGEERGGFYAAVGSGDFEGTGLECVKFWSETFPNGNYGVVGGIGITVLDLDRHAVGQDGWAVFEDWCKRFSGSSDGVGVAGEIRAGTFSVDTAGGGVHLYFKHFPGVSRPLVSGVELQNWGRYVVGPGSALVGGRSYVAYGDPRGVAEAPNWLKKLVQGDFVKETGVDHGSNKKTLTEMINAEGKIPIGFRHDGVIKEIAMMLGMKENIRDIYRIVADLLHCYAEGQLEESEEKFEKELKRNIRNVMRHYKVEVDDADRRWLDDGLSLR